MKKLFVLIALIVITLSAANSAYAAGNSNCEVVYGGGEVCNKEVKFTINKMVQKPTKGGEYVENLTINDTRFQPSQNVNFKIVITNTGDTDITNLNVVDNFPQFLSFVSGVGNSTAGASNVNFVIPTLKKGASVEYVITAKTADFSTLPSNQAVTCVTNNVVATSADGATASDNSQICIEKTIVSTPTPVIFSKPSIKTVPATGPEMGALFGLIPTGLAGFFIRRKTN